MGYFSDLVLSLYVVRCFLHNTHLLDLCLYDMHLQMIKWNNMKEKLTYRYMRKHYIMNKIKMLINIVSDIITNTTSVSWYLLWKCRKYNDECGIANSLYLLCQCQTEG